MAISKFAVCLHGFLWFFIFVAKSDVRIHGSCMCITHHLEVSEGLTVILGNTIGTSTRRIAAS
jgi:hypothetical protein